MDYCDKSQWETILKLILPVIITINALNMVFKGLPMCVVVTAVLLATKPNERAVKQVQMSMEEEIELGLLNPVSGDEMEYWGQGM